MSAAVSVICELARKNPKNYLILAPTLFKLLTRSNNNWMLIKVIKLVLISSISFLFFLSPSTQSQKDTLFCIFSVKITHVNVECCCSCFQFAALTPLEPRLAKRLVEPLSNIINTTSAMSLLYECIQTCIIGLSEFPDVLRLCLTKLRTFIEHPVHFSLCVVFLQRRSPFLNFLEDYEDDDCL